MGDRLRVGPGVTIYQQWQTWWIDSSGGGERIRRSLHTKDKGQAIQKALDILSRKSGPPAKLETLQQSLDRYMKDYSALHHRSTTGKRYKSVIQSFINSLGPDILPQRVDRQGILDFQRDRSKEVEAVTVNGDIGYLKAFLNWCRAEGLIDHDPCFKVRRLKVNQTKRRTPTREEIDDALAAMEASEFLIDYVRVAANSGMRPNEVLHVRGCDFDSRRRLLHITAWGNWRTKDAEDRTIELNKAAATIMRRKKLENGNDELPLFAGKFGGVRDWKNIYHAMKELLPAPLGWMGLYDFRHYFATESVKRGWPVEKLRLYLGHADISTTLKYYVDVKASQVGAPPVTVRMSRPS